MEHNSRTLIVGCQRSGTTMLASLLARIPGLNVYDEGDSYQRLQAGEEGVFKIPRWGDLIPETITGEPNQVLAGPWTWDGEPMLHIFRHPTDTIASMDRLVIDGVSWIDGSLIPLLDWRVKKVVGMYVGVDGELNRWEKAALYWRIKNEAAIRHLKDGRPLLLISYKKLTAEPEKELDRITKWAGLGKVHQKNPSRLVNPAGRTNPQRWPSVTPPAPQTPILSDLTAAIHLWYELEDLSAQHDPH